MSQFDEKKVGDVFGSFEQVELAYVFGSVAREDSGELSDIDFAVYLDEDIGEKDYFDLELELRKRLSPMTGDDIDIVVMNTASTLMNYNVISDGKPLFVASRDLKMEVESRILRTYLDRRYYDRRHVDQRLEKYAERGLV